MENQTQNRPVRKNIRLPDYDYSQNGAYFVTICTQNKAHLLGQVVGDAVSPLAKRPNSLLCKLCDAHIRPHIRLSDCGAVVEKYILSTPGLDKYVIMPNHVHMIILLSGGAMWASPPTKAEPMASVEYERSVNFIPVASPPTNKPSLPAVVSSLKTLVTKDCGYCPWQRGYYEHVTRGERDYLDIWQYIDDNPASWAKDEYFSL